MTCDAGTPRPGGWGGTTTATPRIIGGGGRDVPGLLP